MRTVKIDFCDFGPDFNKDDNFFTHLLRNRWNLIIDSEPEVLIYSCFSNDHLRYKACTKVFFTGENVWPNFRECDFSFGFHYVKNPRNYRLPLYVVACDLKRLIKTNSDMEKKSLRPQKFCSFVVSNAKALERTDFFKRLSNYKPVDSGGRILNNLGYYVDDKISFLSQYKFNIAFENTNFPGYTTEKITDAMLANTIPIYWGNPLVFRDFNSKAFINCHEYKTIDEVMDVVKELDTDSQLYEKKLQEPWFNNNQIPESYSQESILNQFEKIFQYKKPISRGALKIVDKIRYSNMKI